ncbi:unnamed protein product [Effrenium voratum]|nr:unnamed protein product [Effrenium voratum]
MAVPRALFWELLAEEDLPAFAGSSWYDIVPLKDGDVLVFECAGAASQMRRFISATACWSEAEDLPLAVNAVVRSPAAAEKVCILHCPLHWGSDHRYEVYSMDTATDSDPTPEPLFLSATNKAGRSKLVEAGIAPKKRHGFSLAPFQSSLYFLCGLQHFPGDTTGSFVYCFSLEERVWTEVEYEGSFPATKPGCAYSGCRFGQSCVVYDQKAWIFGGCVAGPDGGVEPTNGLFSFDLQEHRWEEVGKMSPEKPPVMTGHYAMAFDGQIFVFGGDYGTQNVHSYNMAQSQWSLLPPLLLGPRPSDGRVVYSLEGTGVVAYQQGAPHDGDQHYLEHCLFKVPRELLSHGAESTSRDTRGLSELDFLGDEASADAEFVIDGTKVPVHRAVLKRFAPALARLFGEGIHRVYLHRMKTPTLQLLLQHIYSRFMLPVAPPEAESMLELAQHFELKPLVRQCTESIVIDSSNVRYFLAFASQANPPLETLNQKCIEYLTSHPDQLSPTKGRGGPPEAQERPVENSQNLQQHLHQHLQQLQQLSQNSAATPSSGNVQNLPSTPHFRFASRGTQPAQMAQRSLMHIQLPAATVQTQREATMQAPLRNSQAHGSMPPSQTHYRPAPAQPGLPYPAQAHAIGDYMRVTDMFQRLAAHEEVVEEETCASYVAQVLAALVHCHSCGAYHHELRPGSVFLTSRQPDARVLLSDVGVLDALEGGSKNGAEADLQGVGLLALALLLGLTPSQAEDVERHLDDPDLWTPRSQEAFDFVKLLLVEDVPCTAALALQHPWLRNILLRPGLASAGLAREDALSRLTCYLLVLLLIPVEMAHRDLERLLADFQRMDEDGDGLLSTRLALRLLALRGVRNGEVAVAVADARGCGVLDFSAMAAAALMADLLPEGGAARVDDILACLQKLFFEAYATDDDGAVAERSHVAEKVSNSVGNLLRRHGDVSFNEILLAFDEEIDQENLATRLTEASGRGTRLALFESGFLAKEEPGSWFTNLFRTCVQPPQRREIVRC